MADDPTSPAKVTPEEPADDERDTVDAALETDASGKPARAEVPGAVDPGAPKAEPVPPRDQPKGK